MEFVNCNLCGQSDEKLVETQNSYRMVKCKNCGLTYLNPRPDWPTLNSLYRSYHTRNQKDVETWKLLMNKIYAETADFITMKFPGPGKLLDIGCGYGHFLNIMRTTGWDVKGIDTSSPAVEYANSKDLSVEHGIFNNDKYTSESFNVVTLFYVLEHLQDPLDMLKKIYSILKPGGILILRVPYTTPIVKTLSIFNIKNNLYDSPFHLYDFSPETLNNIVDKAGYKSINIFPGKSTIPKEIIDRLITIFWANIANSLYTISSGKFILPGASISAVAVKPAQHYSKKY